VALAEDRDRRADAPDESNRCYAERAPRRRDLVYQSDFCYSPDFARCSVFLGWAQRNAAEPAYVTEAAQKAWGSGIAAPEDALTRPTAGDTPSAAADGTTVDPDAAASLPSPTPEGGLFGPAEPSETGAQADGQLDWVSASAWAEAPWDERAEVEADELEELEAEPEAEEDEAGEETEPVEEATQAPKVPAALPMRRRKPPLEPIRSRGSGEWIYADPPGRQPLVSRRSGITPTVLLAVLGVLVVSIVVFLLAAQLGGGDEPPPVAAASPTLASSLRPVATRAPAVTAVPSIEPSPTPRPVLKTWTVKEGQSLSWIAARPKVNTSLKLLQCINRITNPDIIQPGQVLRIPPEGYACPRGWRKSTPEPIE
jgi:nucleoid-associated protein YgaU